MSEYSVRGKDVYSSRGRLVARIDDDGNPVMAPGMAGPHGKAVREFLGATCKENLQAAEPEAVVKENLTTEPEAQSGPKVYIGEPAAAKAGAGCPTQEPEREKTVEEFLIDSIPEDQLPEFSPEYGVYTPGFQEFVKRNNLSPAQAAALINRINNKKR